jgi:hypothetical protein
MTQTIRNMKGEAVLARDGRIGSVEDVYFDDEKWAVRYLVVDTGGWLPGRRVLIPPGSVEPGISSGGRLRLALLREQVVNAPDAESERPVSRHFEIVRAQRLGPPYYWSGPAQWHAGSQAVENDDPHLRSGAEVIGYHIEARDGPIGALQDLAIDERDWAIREVVVDTITWWPGGHVALRPQDVDRIDYAHRKVCVRLTRDEVKHASAPTA